MKTILLLISFIALIGLNEPDLNNQKEAIKNVRLYKKYNCGRWNEGGRIFVQNTSKEKVIIIIFRRNIKGSKLDKGGNVFEERLLPTQEIDLGCNSRNISQVQMKTSWKILSASYE